MLRSVENTEERFVRPLIFRRTILCFGGWDFLMRVSVLMGKLWMSCYIVRTMGSTVEVMLLLEVLTRRPVNYYQMLITR